MPPWLATTLAIVAAVIALAMAAGMELLMLAGMPNSTDDALRQIRRLMLCVGGASAAALVAAIVLMMKGRMLPSITVSGGLCALIVALFLWLLIRG